MTLTTLNLYCLRLWIDGRNITFTIHFEDQNRCHLATSQNNFCKCPDVGLPPIRSAICRTAIVSTSRLKWISQRNPAKKRDSDVHINTSSTIKTLNLPQTNFNRPNTPTKLYPSQTNHSFVSCMSCILSRWCQSTMSNVQHSEVCCTLPPFTGSDYKPIGKIERIVGNSLFNINW
jgi:hypothetical protein